MKAPPSLLRLIEEAGVDRPGEPLPEPPRKAQAQMRAHLRGEKHGYPDFRLTRDVYLGGEERKPSQILTWDPMRSTFSCAGEHCAGLVFWTGDVTDEMVARAHRWDEAVRPHLAGLDMAERNEMTRRYLSGELNRERLRTLRKAGPRRRAAAGKRPEVDERRRRVQAWMLARMRERGVLERILDEAEELQREDPDEWLRIARRSLGRSTLRRYWYDIDPQERAAARAPFERRQAP